MAPDVIDLVSSSPRLPLAPDWGLRSDRKRPARDGPSPGWIGLGHLDDLDDLDDLNHLDHLDHDSGRLGLSDNEPDLHLAPPLARTKRQRILSPARPSANTSALGQDRAARGPTLMPATSRRPLEPIDLSSSLDRGTPRPSRARFAAADVSSDPFASSPPLPSRPRQPDLPSPAEARPCASSDPFASPPRPAREVSEAPAHIRPTCPQHGFSPSPAILAAEDPVTGPLAPSPLRGSASSHARISLSPGPRNAEPREPRMRFVPGGLTRTSSENHVISIDDSDPSGASDGSDLAEIADIGINNPRPPSRRSHSHNLMPNPRSGKPTTPRRMVGKAEREAARAAEKEQRRREREQAKKAKAKEKERAAALEEANKLRTDKKVSTPEMIVDLPLCLASDHKVQIEAILESLGVQSTTWDSHGQNIIKWRRKVTSCFNHDLGRWEPTPLRIHDEKHVLVVITADEFVDLAAKGQLDSHVARVKGAFGRSEIIYLLQGMTPWMRKNRNLRNRQFASDIRAMARQQQQPQQAPAEPGRRGRASARAIVADLVSEDVVEDALLRLQVEHGVLIHHTAVPAETARWVVTLTQHVSTIPYRKQRAHATAAAGFCMESGQVRTGEDAHSTYLRMLQEIVRITAPIAHGVAAEFGSVSKLVRGLEAGGPEQLDRVPRSANKDGQPSDRTIGQAVSRRIYKVFTGRDEGSTDV